MKNLILLVAVVFMFSCSTGNKKVKNEEPDLKQGGSYALELVWQTDTALRTPESVLLDREREVLYVSNVNLNPWEKDGNGFISRVDLSGNIIELKWIEGFDAPKGMGVYGNSLFVADIDVLVEVNIETREIVNRISVEGSPQLNDITVAVDGTVYVSGSGSNTIYKMADGEVEAIYTGGEERFNGLYWEKERMLFITSGSSQFKEYDWDTGKIKVIAENLGHGDGIAPVGDGGYITSNWAGAVFYVSPDGEPVKLLDTEADAVNAADIDYCIETKILYVPTFFDNRLNAYKLVTQ